MPSRSAEHDARRAGAAAARLEARGLGYRVDGRRILGDVTVGLEPGRLVGLVGPNGAGKSTLLRLLDRILRPTEGRILLDGHDIGDLRMREVARKVAFVAQDMEPAFDMPVLEVVLMGRYAHHRRLDSGKADRALARTALERVGLAGLGGRRYHQLSTGERQLVLFARLLAQDTPVLLLDEPTSNLDIAHRERIHRILRELVVSGRAVLAAIHELGEAAARCNNLLLLQNGRVSAAGPPEEVLTRERLAEVYNVEVALSRIPATGRLLIETLEERGPRQAGEAES